MFIRYPRALSGRRSFSHPLVTAALCLVSLQVAAQPENKGGQQDQPAAGSAVLITQPPQNTDVVKVTLFRVTAQMKDGDVQTNEDGSVRVENEEPLKTVELHLISSTNSEGRLRRVVAEQIRQYFQVGELFMLRIKNQSGEALHIKLYDASSDGSFQRMPIGENAAQASSEASLAQGLKGSRDPEKGLFTALPKDGRVQTAVYQMTPPAGTEKITIVVSTEPIDFLVETPQAALRGEVTATGFENIANIGAMFGPLGRYDIATELYSELLKSAQRQQDRAAQVNILNALGLANHSVSRYEDAIGFYKRALELAIEQRTRSKILSNLGLALSSLGLNGEAVKNYEQALNIQRELKDESNEAISLNNLGVAYSSAHDDQKAIEYFEQAVTLHRKLNNRIGEGETLNGLAGAYRSICQKAVAETGYSPSASGATLPDPCRQGIQYVQQSIAIAREVKNKGDEGFALNNLGTFYNLLGKHRESVSCYEQALRIYREAGNRAAEGIALNNLMFAWKRLDSPALAIIYGKQAVDLYQQIRGEIKNLEKATQQSFLRPRADTYRTLAQLLVDSGRIPEAERVLEMLKEEEFSQYIRRDAKEIEKLSKRVGLRDDERVALGRYQLLADKLTAIGLELTKLEEQKNRLTAGTAFAEQARYDELKQQLNDANKAFRLFLEKDLAAEVGKAATKEIEVDRALQGKLQQWGAGTVALYTIVGEDRYRVILTTPKTQTDGKSEKKAADLNQKIFAFREALKNPRMDPRPLGKELYDILVKPIENDLKGAHAQTLVWSLDGTLRYIPLAALWDGEQYLAQKYRIVVVTSTTRQSLSESVDPNWRVLGLGVTKESKVIEPFGTIAVSFDALPGVDKELQAIVSSEDAKQNERGVLKGKRLLDDEFTVGEMENRLGQHEGDKRRYNIIHFATHFRLGGDTATSFLLLGKNQAMTLEQVSDSPEMNLTDVELVTLSACNTGYSSLVERKVKEKEKEQFLKNNGREVDSLAAFIEGRGAKAVLATLWPVADESTQFLMAEFYRLRKENPNMTKAEALRRAQLTLVNGEIRNAPDGIRRADLVGNASDTTALPRFPSDPQKPYAHPYYWAPFILIGNWR